MIPSQVQQEVHFLHVDLDQTPGASNPPKNDLTQMWAKFHLYPFQGACCLVYLRSVAALSSPFLETVPFSLGKSAL